MLEKGEYLTPWIDMGKGPEPYLGKPPMHFWLTVASYKLFGVSATSARLPSFVSTVLCAVFLFLFTRRVWGSDRAVVATLVFLTSGLVFFLAGAAVLDTTLMLFTTGALLLLAAFYLCGFARYPRLTAAGFGACLAGGFLTKGPVAVAIVVAATAPLLALFFARGNLARPAVPRFPVFTALVVFVCLALPWYLACEYYRPGFLWYFIVKENLLRIVSENYGDRYGTGHPQMFGMSIVFLLASFMPWSVGILLQGWKVIRNRTTPLREALSISRLRERDPVLLFAIAWGLSMPVFLLLTSQYTANYLAPIMPGLALWYAGVYGEKKTVVLGEKASNSFKWGTLVILAIVVFLPTVGFLFFGAPSWVLVWATASCGVALFYYLRLFGERDRTKAPKYNCQHEQVSTPLVLLYVSVILSFSGHISARRSTREALELVRLDSTQDTSIGPVKVGFIEQIPFSSSVYGYLGAKRIQSRKVFLSELPHLVSDAGCDYLIMSVRSPFAPDKDVASSLVEVGRTRKWLVLHDKGCGPGISNN